MVHWAASLSAVVVEGSHVLFYLLVNLVMFFVARHVRPTRARLAGSVRALGATGRALSLARSPLKSVTCSVVVFFVRALSFENDIAGQSVLDSKAELGLVEHVFLRL